MGSKWTHSQNSSTLTFPQNQLTEDVKQKGQISTVKENKGALSL